MKKIGTKMKRTTNRASWWGYALVAALGVAVYTPSCANGGVGGTGNITGFGSIFVNGVEWFTESATVLLDGVEATEADLQLGMIVHFSGTIDAAGTTGTVTSVVFDDAIEGPVSDVEITSSSQKTLTILGQAVSVEDGFTFFDATDPTLDLDAIATGDILEISGYAESTGAIRASWMRRLGQFVPGTTHVELEGLVADLSAAPAFRLGPIAISITPGTDLSELWEELANGIEVEVEGTALTPTHVVASRIAVPERHPTDVAELSLEGIVTNFVSISDFQVSGQAVDATAAEFEPSGVPFLADGVLVEVEGPLLGNVLVATEVELEQAVLEIAAPLLSASHIDPATGRLWLLGLEIETSPETEFSDDRDELADFDLIDILPGDFLQVRAFRSGSGARRATELSRTEVDGITLDAPVAGFDPVAERLVLLELLVHADGETAFKAESGSKVPSAEFFSELWIGRSIQASGLRPGESGEWIPAELELAD